MSKCILCGNESKPFLKTESYEIWKCSTCGLFYSDPMQLPDFAGAYFSDAYRGEVKTPEMIDIGMRLRFMQGRHASDRSFLLIRAAHPASLDWIKENAPAGSTILDVGCGPGAFLHQLRKYGFHAVGVEPSADIVKILKEEGFEAYNGTIEKIPLECPTPFAITLHYMIHHLVDPVAAVELLRIRFPKAYLLIGENLGFRTKSAPASLPPRALTWWSAESLRFLLSKTGYEVENILPLMPKPEEYVSSTLSSLYMRFFERWLPASRIWPLWIRLKKYLFLPKATAERLAKRPPGSFLAIGHPPEDSNMKNIRGI